MRVDVKYGSKLREHVDEREVTKENSHMSHKRGRKNILLLAPSQELQVFPSLIVACYVRLVRASVLLNYSCILELQV